MSYEVLARKYRPLTFDDVVGQDHITRTLKRAVETGRISHAYMFAGPRGCGKTSTARILARVINCENLSGGNPCNECASCRAVIAGSNLDVMEIDGASHTGVAEVRDLQEALGYAPSQFRNKVYIIDEVHMLSTHAFNALLKTLEEPPAHVYFVFATTAPQKIPDTIKSRCQRHHFKRIEVKEIAGQLETMCKAEKVTYEDDALRLLARKADGSMRDGASLLDQCVTSSGGNVTTDAVRDILGLIDQDRVLAFMGAIAGGEPAGALRLLDQCVGEGLDLQELTGALLDGYRDLMLLATPGDLSDLLFRSAEEIEALRLHLDHYELADVVTLVERLVGAVPRLKSASDPRVLLESLLVDLCLLERQTDIRELISRLEGGVSPSPDAGKSRRRREPPVAGGGPGATASGAATSDPDRPARAPQQTGAIDLGGNPASAASEAPPPPPPPAPGEDLDLEKLQELWGGFVTFVRQKKVSLGVCLMGGKLHSFEGNRLALRFGRSFALQRDQVANPKSIQFLRSMFHRYFGREIELAVLAEGEEKTFALEERARKQPKPEQRFAVSDEKKPVIKRILKEFDGEVVRYKR